MNCAFNVLTTFRYIAVGRQTWWNQQRLELRGSWQPSQEVSLTPPCTARQDQLDPKHPWQAFVLSAPQELQSKGRTASCGKPLQSFTNLRAREFRLLPSALPAVLSARCTDRFICYSLQDAFASVVYFPDI